jgi:hypothetical protein
MYTKDFPYATSIINKHTEPEIPFKEYKYVLPGDLHVLKFQDNYYQRDFNNKLTSIHVTDMGRTINMISYLSSKWLCNNYKFMRTNILDVRGNWQIKAARNPNLPVYTVTINKPPKPDPHYKGSYSAGGVTIYSDDKAGGVITLEELNIHSQTIIRALKQLVNYYQSQDLELTKLTVSFQYVKLNNGTRYYIIDNILMPTDCLFKFNDAPDLQHDSNPVQSGVQVNNTRFSKSYLSTLSEMVNHNIDVTEDDICDCYNNIFNVLVHTPGFIDPKNKQTDPAVVNKILYNATTIEEYIETANQETNGKYY